MFLLIFIDSITCFLIYLIGWTVVTIAAVIVITVSTASAIAFTFIKVPPYIVNPDRRLFVCLLNLLFF